MKTSSQTKHQRNETFASVVLATSRILEMYGWNEDVAEEFCRPILRVCSAESAVKAFREIFDSTQLMPSQELIISEAQGVREEAAPWYRSKPFPAAPHVCK